MPSVATKASIHDDGSGSRRCRVVLRAFFIKRNKRCQNVECYRNHDDDSVPGPATEENRKSDR